MAETLRIEPDVGFIRAVIASGGGDIKKCYQCATCSVACDLSSDDVPFPRRQMLAAQWGLRDRLMADPALWLCHNCGKCTERCPRGARPGEVLGAIRAQVIRQFAAPAFVGRLVAYPAALPLLLLVPIVIFAAIAANAPGPIAGNALEFGQMFPARILEPLFFLVSGLALLAFATGIVRFVRAMAAAGVPPPSIASLRTSLVDIARHDRFARCDSPVRFWGHLFTFWGFVGLAAMGTTVGIGTMTGTMHTPLALASPLKLFANAAAAVTLVGTLLLLADRVGDAEARAHSTYFDWAFLLALVGAVATGLAAEILRLEQAAQAMYAVYFVHLVLIFSLFLYAPYSKFAHLAYRTVAMAAAARQR